MDPQTAQVEILPISIFQSETEVSPPEPGTYAIVLRGVGGGELARYPFNLEGLEGGAAPGDGTETESAYISELIPFEDGISRIEIEGPAGNIIFQVEAGLTLPAVQVLAPNGGEIFDNFDPIGNYPPVYIVVAATIPKYDLYLPSLIH